MEATSTEVEGVTTIIEVETVDITDRILEAMVDINSRLGMEAMGSNLPGMAGMAINPLEMVDLEVTRATIEEVETTRMTGMEVSSRAVEVEGAVVVVVDTVAGVETAGTTATEMVLERMLANPEEDTTHEGIG